MNFFQRERVAVFVNGYFLHGCQLCCRCSAANRLYWDAKVNRNKTPDRDVSRTLRKEEWFVVRVWEHSLKNYRPVITRILKAFALTAKKKPR